MLGIWTKLKYHNSPIHMIATTTCVNLNNQLQKIVSNANPSFKKNNDRNNRIDKAKEAWTVLDKDDRKLPIIVILYTK